MRVDLQNCTWWRSEPELEMALRKAIADGLTSSQAAGKLSREFRRNITRNAVIGRAHRLGLSFRGRRIKQTKGG